MAYIDWLYRFELKAWISLRLRCMEKGCRPEALTEIGATSMVE
jgi:hypothetical protein